MSQEATFACLSAAWPSNGGETAGPGRADGREVRYRRTVTTSDIRKRSG